MKKLLIITLFLGMTFPVFAQDETQSATDEAVSQAFTESVDVEHSPGFLPGHRGRGHHRGPHGNRGRHVGPPTPTPSPSPTPGCVYTLMPQGAHALASGDIGSVTVTATPANCEWDAFSNSGFIHVTGFAGNTVSFSVDPNPTFFTRSGTMTIAGVAFTVGQDGAFPSYDGTYNVSYTVIVTYTGPPPGPPPVSQSGSTSWTFVNGVIVNGGGVTTGTISPFGEVNVATVAGGVNLQFTGSFNETGNGLGLLTGGGVPFVSIGGSWQGARQ